MSKERDIDKIKLNLHIAFTVNAFIVLSIGI